MHEPTHLDLFSGIGGFALAAQWAGFRTIGFCEIDGYCRKVLAKNFMGNAVREPEHISIGGSHEEGSRSIASARTMDAGDTNCGIRIFQNIFDLDGRAFKGVDLITGGFPCQPFSVAGNRRGAADDRAIWPEMFRVIAEARPTWVLGENVPGIISMELDNVLSQLEGIGYATRTFVIPACAVDARHRRDRVWIVGRLVPDSERERGRCGDTEWKDAKDAGEQCGGEGTNADAEHYGLPAAQPGLGTKRATQREDKLQQPSGSSPVRNPTGQGLPDGRSASMGTTGGLQSESERPDSNGECRRESFSRLGGMVDGVSRWLDEPDISRVATGVKERVNRLKGLGNAIVPQVAYEILKEIRKMIP